MPPYSHPSLALHFPDLSGTYLIQEASPTLTLCSGLKHSSPSPKAVGLLTSHLGLLMAEEPAGAS